MNIDYSFGFLRGKSFQALRLRKIGNMFADFTLTGYPIHFLAPV